MKIAYCEHPVTKAEKAEFKSKGFKILDIAYQPKKLEKGDEVFKHQKAKAKKDD